MRLVTRWMLLSGVLLGAACAHKQDARTVKETGRTENLTYTMQIDTTRLVRGSGLKPVAAVARLLEDGLATFFRVEAPVGGAATEARQEVVAEAPAPGFFVRAVVEARPDDYALVTIDVLREEGGDRAPTTVAPYSVLYGVKAVQASLGSLKAPNRPALTPARFASLRKQATEYAARGEDAPMDEATYARTPRPLDRTDEEPRYYAPPDTSTSTLRR